MLLSKKTKEYIKFLEIQYEVKQLSLTLLNQFPTLEVYDVAVVLIKNLPLWKYKCPPEEILLLLDNDRVTKTEKKRWSKNLKKGEKELNTVFNKRKKMICGSQKEIFSLLKYHKKNYKEVCETFSFKKKPDGSVIKSKVKSAELRMSYSLNKSTDNSIYKIIPKLIDKKILFVQSYPQNKRGQKGYYVFNPWWTGKKIDKEIIQEFVWERTMKKTMQDELYYN